MKLSTTIVISTCVALLLASCDRQVQNFDDSDCSAGKAGWKRAQSVTPDVVGKCHTGSQGTCVDDTFEYVSGTGWCQPK